MASFLWRLSAVATTNRGRFGQRRSLVAYRPSGSIGFANTLRKSLATILVLASAFAFERCLFAQIAPGKYNNVILDQIRAMPTGGKYSASRTATIRLQSAAHF